MTLHEPATFLTDCLLAGWSGWLASRLRGDQPALVWWRRAFAATAVAALAGGVFHGFGPEMPDPVAKALWHGTLLAIVTTSLCLLQAGAQANLTGVSLRWVERLAWVKAVAFAGGTLLDPRFLIVIADYGSAMILLFGLEAYAARRRAPHAPWVMAGVATSALAALVQQAKWSPATHFNHNDLYHVIQMFALGLFFGGARRSERNLKDGVSP